jgi:hypothetical protein
LIDFSENGAARCGSRLTLAQREGFLRRARVRSSEQGGDNAM